MKRNKNKERKLRQAIDALRDSGYNIVCVISKYAKKNAHFSTRLSVRANKKAKVSKDHVVLDAQREILRTWSKARH